MRHRYQHQTWGAYDIKQHIDTNKHMTKARAVKAMSGSMGKFVSSSNKTDLPRSIRAEVMLTDFVLEHNLPLAVADHATSLVKKMFPDSTIAEDFKCRRTKMTEIVKTLADNDKKIIVDNLQGNVFSLATDGSNDMEDKKLYPILVRYFDNTICEVVTVLLALKECNKASTGENIFKLLDNELSANGLNWDQVISFGTDNASVMTGRLNGVSAFIHRENENVNISGCPCHLLHIAAQKGYGALDMPVEDIVIDIYYYLHRSSKRQQNLKQFQDLFDKDTSKIIKHVHTRWLSLQKCLTRVLDQWEPLLLFFREESKGSKVNIQCH
jgi:hypothetical protein